MSKYIIYNNNNLWLWYCYEFSHMPRQDNCRGMYKYFDWIWILTEKSHELNWLQEHKVSWTETGSTLIPMIKNLSRSLNQYWLIISEYTCQAYWKDIKFSSSYVTKKYIMMMTVNGDTYREKCYYLSLLLYLYFLNILYFFKYSHTNIFHRHTYPKKYAHGFCFAVLCCG